MTTIFDTDLQKNNPFAEQRVDRFRRTCGLVLGLAIALTYALITQWMVRLEMPGVPLHQPPLGPWGNTLVLLAVGGVIGLLTAWPEEPIYGVVFGSVAGTTFFSLFTFFTAPPLDPQAGATVFSRMITLVFTFLPIAGMFAPLMILLRWVISRLTSAYRRAEPIWKVAWIPLLLITVVTGIALLVRLPDAARQELRRTHAMIQTGLAAAERADLPEPFQARDVGDFLSQASAGYTLEWDKNHTTRYGIPRLSSSSGGQEAVVVARFDNDWLLVCLYGSADTDPACKGIGGEAGRTIFSSNAPDPFKVAWDDFSLFEANLVPGEPALSEPLDRASRYHVQLDLPADGDTLSGRMQVRYTHQENVPLDEIYFRLYPNLAGGKLSVQNVTVDGQAAQTSLEAQDSALKVSLPEPLQPGQSRVIGLDFTLEVPTELGGNYGLLSHIDQVWALDAFLPTIAVYDESGWHIQPTPPNGDNTFNDAAYYLVQINAPEEMKLASSGWLVGGEHTPGGQRAVFAAGPGRDFYLAASPRFVVSSEQVGLTSVNAYSLPELSEGNLGARRVAADALRVFNARYGAYPYTELDLVSIPMTALGVEYPGIIGISADSYASAPGSGSSGESQVRFRTTIAHEVAHQWFYNLVGNDQSSAPWLDEALAQHATWQFLVDLYGDGITAGELVDYWRGCVEQTDSGDTPIGLPAGDYPDGRAYVGSVYCRGPLFMAALREEMGVDAWDVFLRAYLTEERWKIATPADFRRIAEATCECDLSTIFAEWVNP